MHLFECVRQFGEHVPGASWVTGLTRPPGQAVTDVQGVGVFRARRCQTASVPFGHINDVAQRNDIRARGCRPPSHAGARTGRALRAAEGCQQPVTSGRR